jgi:hypothetical protein
MITRRLSQYPRSAQNRARSSRFARSRSTAALLGVQDPTAVPRAEIDAYLDLLHTGDGGQAFLKIMRSWERTRAKRDLYRRVLGDGRYPVQVVWGAHDPAIKLTTEGEAARRAAAGRAFESRSGRNCAGERLFSKLTSARGFTACGQLLLREVPRRGQCRLT